ncbi:MAG TPA: hypothetical protein PLW05_10165 [Candidatus Marinimicrobia bacterium]|nr:hypothetical protein [Candidatus Neomarinimicrobiota bacterium]HQE95583.1 hypothetical protein [Candidatus Neomarinimicrobiota bacterium]HQH56899.1 hypothetical protein [Candidatus Neomarinimicrobiota bacterium]
MKRNKITFFITILFCLFVGQCNTPTSDDGSAPQQPDWLDVHLSLEQLPGVNSPSQLIFDINVIGKDGDLYVTNSGDTLNFLYVMFASNDWVVGLNADADTLWRGKVDIGTRITLKPVFQIDSALIPVDTLMNVVPLYPGNGDAIDHFWSHIDLRAMFLISENELVTDKDSLFERYGYLGYRLFFDYRTGDYTFDN